MKVLIADDEPVAARILQRAVESSAREVIVTSNGIEAWEAFDREPVRIVVSDWVMPKLDGLELCRRIRKRKDTPYTYYILLTQKETKSENYDLAAEAGVDDFLTKPLDRPAIRMRLRVAERILRSTTEIRQLKELIAARKKSERLLRAANAALLESEKQILAISEEERHRIGADLHDNVGQQLTAIELLCHSLRQDLDGHAQWEMQMGQICQFLQNAVTQTRQLARGLVPVALTADGLVDRLAELAREMSQGPVHCNFICPAPVDIYDSSVASHLFHIAQEAVNNAAKHAHARQITVTLAQLHSGVILRIEDDGQGFPKLKKPAPGVGLRNMHHRANVIGALLETKSRPGKGVVVNCTLPKRS